MTTLPAKSLSMLSPEHRHLIQQLLTTAQTLQDFAVHCQQLNAPRQAKPRQAALTASTPVLQKPASLAGLLKKETKLCWMNRCAIASALARQAAIPQLDTELAALVQAATKVEQPPAILAQACRVLANALCEAPQLQPATLSQISRQR